MSRAAELIIKKDVDGVKLRLSIWAEGRDGGHSCDILAVLDHGKCELVEWFKSDAPVEGSPWRKGPGE